MATANQRPTQPPVDQVASDIAFKAEAVLSHLKAALGAVADANDLVKNDHSLELMHVRMDLRDLLTGLQLTCQRATKWVSHTEAAPRNPGDTQPFEPVKP